MKRQFQQGTARAAQQGIALVITLIMLSVITFMAVTFLVVSRHEGEQVDTTTQQNISKFGADAILQMAEAQIAAQMMGTTNGYTNLGLQVSTDYYQYSGYDSTVPNRTNLNNVSYTYPPPPNGSGGPLSQADQQQMLNNLLYLPRAPVFISTNRNQPNPEFRFYLDENGNGVFDTNGAVTETDLNGNTVVNTYTGDPEWIGFLEHPEQRHSASNMFLARGAFMALPIGNSLDINHVHNQSKFLINSSLASSAYEGFFRNQGVGTWEISLAGLLQTLNTNVWGGQLAPNNYVYSTNPMIYSQQTAFFDAASIMQYRYNENYKVLSPFANLYGNNAFNSYLINAGIDAYAVGPLMTGVNPPGGVINLNTASPWSGADNPAQIVRPRDLLTTIPGLDFANALDSFTNRLYQAGVTYNPNPPTLPPSITNSYNRYTFYRMLSQIGVGSAPEPQPYPIGGSFSTASISAIQSGPPPTSGLPPNVPAGRNQMSFGSVPEAYPYVHGHKMNLNYDNIDYSETNFAPWTPVGFFTNAADRMLRTSFPTNFALLINGTPVVTNLNINFIPIYPVNYYTPAVHRILQLAANMYDASTNKINGVVGGGIDYPSVFRPYFATTNSGVGSGVIVYIAGYTEAVPVGKVLPANCLNAPLDLRRPTDLSKVQKFDTVNNIYGVPYVVGARPNLPNFNQFSMATVVQISRALQFTRTSPLAPVSSYKTNVAYTIGVSNVLGVQCWNSYTNSFTRPQGIRLLVTNDYSLFVTNTLNASPYYTPVPTYFGNQPQLPFQINPSWSYGVSNGAANVAASFAVPLMTNAIVVPPGSYLQQNGTYTTTNSSAVFLPLAVDPVTHSYYPDWGISVTNRVRVIIQDIATGRILDYVQLGGLGQLAGLDEQDLVMSNLYTMGVPPNYNVWDTNALRTNNPMTRGIFNQYAISYGTDPVPASYWAASPSGSSPNSIQLATNGFQSWLKGSNTANSIQLPFVAATTFAKVYTWSANDPLVHYTVGDLTDLTKTGVNSGNNKPILLTTASPTNVLSGLNLKSTRYWPWGQIPGDSVMSLIGQDEIEYTDPQMTQSSAWQFPTNKYPNIGWIGRVHRGTPWQTVYLKPHSTSFTNTAWQYWTGNPNVNDAITAQPMNDWQLLDLFTTAPNDNASRGQLSVNQTNAAAWAAVLDGVMVISNSTTGLIATNIDTSQPVAQNLIAGINAYRATMPNQVFTSVGQVFGAAALTTGSPYLGVNNANLTDAVYERIPQQIAGLLRVGTPRYAIYAYGQALKPANNSIVQSGQFFGMCTNYQITGEVLTRTIVRFDNMPVPGYPAPGQSYTNALPIQNATTPEYVNVVYTMPLMKTVVESYEVLGPDQ